MTSVNFQGLVQIANRVRNELAAPMSPDRREYLRGEITRTLTAVARTLGDHGTDLQNVPTPSRRAIQFLQSVNLDAACVTADSSLRVAASATLRGLRSLLERVTHQLAKVNAPSTNAVLHPWAEVRRAAQRIGQQMVAQQIAAEQLVAPSRDALAWVRFFSETANAVTYVESLRSAMRVFEGIASPAHWSRPIHVVFRPIRALYRARSTTSETLVVLATPFVACSREQFERVGLHVFGARGRSRRDLFEITVSDEYQSIRSEIDDAVPVPEQARGVTHDLAESFARVNARFFGGSMSRPRLTWSALLTVRKFGHYNFASDTVMVSRTLDRRGVPAFVVDHVMHHELLHKKHGIRWRGNRGCCHDQTFRADERAFERCDEAEKWLQLLATQVRSKATPA